MSYPVWIKYVHIYITYILLEEACELEWLAVSLLLYEISTSESELSSELEELS